MYKLPGVRNLQNQLDKALYYRPVTRQATHNQVTCILIGSNEQQWQQVWRWNPLWISPINSVPPVFDYFNKIFNLEMRFLFNMKILDEKQNNNNPSFNSK